MGSLNNFALYEKHANNCSIFTPKEESEFHTESSLCEFLEKAVSY